MGCSNSKVNNEEGLAICKQRKHLMKQTVTSRHNLATSHALYMISLKRVGSAFRQFAEGEVKGDGDSHSMYSTTETPNTPRTPPTKSGASTSFSTSPLSPQTHLSALQLQPRSPKSITWDFLRPPPSTIVNPMDYTPLVIPTNIHKFEDSNSSSESFRMEDKSQPPIQGNRRRRYWGRKSIHRMKGHHVPPPHIIVNAMEHTPPVIPTKIHRFEDSNSYMKSFRTEDDSHLPPMMQSIEGDDNWRYSRSRSAQHIRGHNAPPPPPPLVTQSSWQDLFLDPFRPTLSHVNYNYVDDRQGVDMEGREMEWKKNYQYEMMMKRKHEAEAQERRAREMEQKKMHERSSQFRPPPVKIVDVRGLPMDHGVPDLEEEIPELEDVDEHIDGPPPLDFVYMTVKTSTPTPKQEPKVKVKFEPQQPPPNPQPQQRELEIKPIPKVETAPKVVEPPPPPSPPKVVEPLLPPLPPKVVELPPPPSPPKVVEPPPPPPSPPKVVEPPPPPSPPKVVEPPPPPSPPKVVEATKIPPRKPPKPNPTFAKTNRNLAMAVTEQGGRDLLDVLKEVDECFFRVAQCGESVSQILETKKPHHHSSFSDGLRGVGESARMNFRKLSSFRTSSNMSSLSNTSVLTDDSPNIMSMRRSVSNMSSQRFTQECGLNSHAASLEKLLAWEKKLYSEVKQAEALKVDLERKLVLLKNQDHKNEVHNAIDKTRSTIKALQTRMVVAIQAVDNGYQQVQKLRDEELYPQLVDLLDGIGAMWREMSVFHKAQLKAVEAIGRLENSAAFESTTSFHRQATAQLELALNKWSEALSKHVLSQKEHLKNLTAWLRMSLMQFGSDEMDDRKSGSRSPSRSPQSPYFNIGPSPIYELCLQWQELLDRVTDKVATEAIFAFAAVVREMFKFQTEELRMKKKVETYERELERREQSMHAASVRESMREGGPSPGLGPLSRSPTTTSGSDMDDHRFDMVLSNHGNGIGSGVGSEVAEKRMKCEATRRKLEDGREAVRKASVDTRTYTLNSLQIGLPQLFQAIIAFVNMEADVYEKLSK